jgi:DNA-binding transcriptional LysR family regulator
VELRHLRYFVAVADELHFGRAAARLHMTQPPLSKQIQDLETELGLTLFDRSRRQIRLTREGAELLTEARRILARAETFREFAAKVGAGRAGELRVGVVHSSLYGVVPTILRRFRDQHPDVRLTVHEAVTGTLLDELAGERLDVAFVRPDAFPDGTDTMSLLAEPLDVVLPHQHPLARTDRPINVEELRDDPLVLFRRELGAGYWDLVVGAYQRAGVVPRIGHLADQVATMVGLVAAGLGITIVPVAMRNLMLPGVSYHPLQPGLRLPLLVAWRRDADNPAHQPFLAAAADTAAR